MPDMAEQEALADEIKVPRARLHCDLVTNDVLDERERKMDTLIPVQRKS